MMFKRVSIIGLGLIGGSIGLAIKEKRLAKEVVGVSRRKSTVQKALALGIVDFATLDVEKGVKDADLVILTTPVLTIIDIADRIRYSLKKGVIVTDAGSTKRDIVSKIEVVLPETAFFVGSHPIAGSEKTGVNYADKDLFKEAYCILTKTQHTDLKALVKVEKFWCALGMRVEIMSPAEHDRVLSGLSHLPHAVSVALVNACSKSKLYLAAGGFKDTTRIAAGSPELWQDIFVTNKDNIIKGIGVFKKELEKIEKALKADNRVELDRVFEKAKKIRDSV